MITFVRQVRHFLGVLLTMASIAARASEWDCTQTIEAIKIPVRCAVSESTARDVRLSAVVDLKPVVAAFPARLQAAVRSDDCRKRWRVERASLAVEGDQFRVDATVWAEMQVCKGRFKTRVVEKTGDVVAYLTPEVHGSEIRLVSRVVDTGLSEAETLLAELSGLDVRGWIEDELDRLLRFRLDEVRFPFGVPVDIKFRSVQLKATPPTLTLHATATLATGG